jgi:hypothetical protein
MLFKPIVSLKKLNASVSRLILLLLLLCVELYPTAAGQESKAPDQRPRSQLSAEQTVQNLVNMNLQRAQALLAYPSTRIYSRC